MKQKKADISVVVPVYNNEKTLGVLLASIINQRNVLCELIVVDDGSNDRSVEIAKRYTDRVYERKHQERSVQRNFGAEKAVGKYVAFLDSDMELTSGVLTDVVNCMEKNKYGGLVIPERTVGSTFLNRIRKFEREMYMGDMSIEVARVFPKKVFFEFEGYDEKLTGPEDYDLPYRISKKYVLGRSKKYILHHEEDLTLFSLLKKRFYYASKGFSYALKHPELTVSQGNMLLRSSYFKNWKKFVKDPLLGLSFITVKLFEFVSALLGIIKGAGIVGFLRICALFIKNLICKNKVVS